MLLGIMSTLLKVSIIDFSSWKKEVNGSQYLGESPGFPDLVVSLLVPLKALCKAALDEYGCVNFSSIIFGLSSRFSVELTQRMQRLPVVGSVKLPVYIYPSLSISREK